jgi:ABC-type multidrug transport system fused ATPase/permease subunit
VEEHAGFVVKNEEEAKHLLRVEIGDLLHMLVMQNPGLKNWAISVQDCVYGMLEGETRDSCKAVYSEHIGDETKHIVWRIVVRILFTTRCRVIASQEADEKVTKFRIKIYDLETIVLMVTSIVLLLSFYLPTPMAIVTSIVGIVYSALVAWLKRRRSPLFLEWLKNLEVKKRTRACLNDNVPGTLSEIRKIKESLNKRLSS